MLAASVVGVVDWAGASPSVRSGSRAEDRRVHGPRQVRVGIPARGKAVFRAHACGSCHTFSAADSFAIIGPNLDTTLPRDARTARKPLGAFVLEALLKPDTFRSPTYPRGVMPSFASLPKQQLDDLVAFLIRKPFSGSPERAPRQPPKGK